MEKALKLPLANYDLVVYFGVGAATLPLISRYFIAKGKTFPALFSGFPDKFMNDAVSIVSLFFVVYILGHGIAYLASLFIETPIYRVLGKPSTVIAEASAPTSSGKDQLRDHVKSRFLDAFKHPYLSDILNLIFHLPVIPLYILVYILKVFGFYQTKLNPIVCLRVHNRLTDHFDYVGDIFGKNRWFKIVEYSCANDHPAAMSKMYNYLVIFGLFRSVAFILLLSIWAELAYVAMGNGIAFIDENGNGNIMLRLFVLELSYFISFASFCKFSRRYAEEAIQAFALSKHFETNSSVTN